MNFSFFFFNIGLFLVPLILGFFGLLLTILLLTIIELKGFILHLSGKNKKNKQSSEKKRANSPDYSKIPKLPPKSSEETKEASKQRKEAIKQLQERLITPPRVIQGAPEPAGVQQQSPSRRKLNFQ